MNTIQKLEKEQIDRLSAEKQVPDFAPGDTLRVTCTFDANRRAKTRPAQKPRYTLWGEGTTDEMCLGVLQVTRG